MTIHLSTFGCSILEVHHKRSWLLIVSSVSINMMMIWMMSIMRITCAVWYDDKYFEGYICDYCLWVGSANQNQTLWIIINAKIVEWAGGLQGACKDFEDGVEYVMMAVRMMQDEPWSIWWWKIGEGSCKDITNMPHWFWFAWIVREGHKWPLRNHCCGCFVFNHNNFKVSLMMMCLLECSMFTSSPSIVSQQFPPHLPNENGHDHSDYDYNKGTCEKDNGSNYHQALMVHLLNI